MRWIHNFSKKERIKNSIKDLLNDHYQFAKLIASIQFSSVAIDFNGYEEGVYASRLIIVKKSDIKNIPEAFSLLFKRLFFDDYEWELSTEEPLPGDEQWLNNLRDSFIPEYFIKHAKLIWKKRTLNRS